MGGGPEARRASKRDGVICSAAPEAVRDPNTAIKELRAAVELVSRDYSESTQTTKKLISGLHERISVLEDADRAQDDGGPEALHGDTVDSGDRTMP